MILWLVPEMTSAGEDHGNATLVGGGDHLGITDGSARLNGSSRSCFRSRNETIREWEEGIGADNASLEGEAGLASFPDSDPGGIDAGHLSCTDTKGAILAGIDDGVALHMLDDLPAEFHRLDFILGRRTAGDDMVLDASGALFRGDIGILDKHAADDRADITIRGGNFLQQAHESQVLLFLKQGTRIDREFGRDDDLTKDLGNRSGKRLVDRTIGDDDATEGCGTVGCKGFLPSLGEVLIAADAARVGVLQDGDGRLLKFTDQAGGCRDIEDVVEGELLAMELLDRKSVV